MKSNPLCAGFSYHRRVAFREVRAASLSSHSRLGFGKLGQAIEIEVPPPPPPAPSKARQGSGRRGAPANETIAFSSNTEPERLIELIKLLVSIHAEDAEGADGEGR